MSDYAEKVMARASLERDEGWDEILGKVPAIKFRSDWGVKIVPPFAGAVARFVVCKGEARVSVYLDWHDRLGCMDEPYWEIYPAADGDTDRFLLSEGDRLTAQIGKSLTAQNRRKAKS